MRIAIGSDHTGYALRQQLTAELEGAGHDIADYGCPGTDSVDYPDIAEPLAEAVVAGEHDLGIVICSNGVGISIAANKIPGARAALCADAWTARRAREHTDCNILALGAYAVGSAIASEIVQTFISTEFEGGRHSRRLAKLAAIEERSAERSDLKSAQRKELKALLRTLEFKPATDVSGNRNTQPLSKWEASRRFPAVPPGTAQRYINEERVRQGVLSESEVPSQFKRDKPGDENPNLAKAYLAEALDGLDAIEESSR